MFAPQTMWTRFQAFHEEPGDGGGGGGGGGGTDEAVKKAAFERDQATAKAAKFQKELDELKKALPTDEQKARWAELESAAEKTEEERKKKAGEFDAWRTQIADKHAKDLEAERKRIEAETHKAAEIEKELHDTLKGLSFAGASDLFGPTGSTVLMPAIAQAYFANQVEVVKDETSGARRVVVKDATGSVLVDPKTGAPMEFARAMKELIDSHPDRDHLLRGSGKVGSGSPGGGHGSGHQIDLNRLKPSDFHNPKVREALRQQSEGAGGLVVAPALRRLQQK